MYEALIKELRYLAKVYSICENTNTKEYRLAVDAAYAIEELSRKIESLESMREITPEAEYAIDKHADNIISHMDELIRGLENEPRWIPVTERLPEEPYGCLVVVWDNPTYGGGDMFLNYYPEFVGWDGDQWNDWEGEKIPLDVAYWMPLPKIPEPPKEET